MVLSSCLASLPHFKTRTISNGKHGPHASGWPRSQITYGSLCSKALNQVISSMNTVRYPHVSAGKRKKEAKWEQENEKGQTDQSPFTLWSAAVGSRATIWTKEKLFNFAKRFLDFWTTQLLWKPEQINTSISTVKMLLPKFNLIQLQRVCTQY